jgi:alkanesulfonate monooxygenase SsuD/methylene tetrahydromethanopterin reductase-like flavin-dependent oxidoreductase (luciferase family)
MSETGDDLGTYSYAEDIKAVDESGALDLLSLEYLVESGACVVGTPDDCLAACRRYEEAGVDTLLCLVNPYDIPHAAVMQTIELMGREVIPHFR